VSGKRGSRPLSGAGAEGTGAGPRVVLTALGASILRATLLVAGLILMQPPSKVNTRGALALCRITLKALKTLRSGFS
jgi:hypothetical protein